MDDGVGEVPENGVSPKGIAVVENGGPERITETVVGAEGFLQELTGCAAEAIQQAKSLQLEAVGKEERVVNAEREDLVDIQIGPGHDVRLPDEQHFLRQPPSADGVGHREHQTLSQVPVEVEQRVSTHRLQVLWPVCGQ